MSGNNNKKRGEGRGKTPSRGGSSNKRPSVTDGKGHRKKTKRSDNTTNTGRNTRTRSVVDYAHTLSTVPKVLQDFNKSSRKENKEKEGLDKTSRKLRQKRSDTTTSNDCAAVNNNNKNSGSNKHRESSKYKDDSDYYKTSSEEEEEDDDDDDEAWENDNTTKKKAKKKPTTTTTTKKKNTAVTMERRTQLRQLNRPVSIMFAWDKPKKKNFPPQWPKSVSNYIVIKKTNMETSRISLEGIIQLVQDYLPNNYEFGSHDDMNVF